MSDMQERVNRGAQLLDEKIPGWIDLINLETLQMSSGFRCVLGQASGDYEFTAYKWAKQHPEYYDEVYEIVQFNKFTQDHGFALEPDERFLLTDNWRELEQLWTNLIQERRALAALSS